MLSRIENRIMLFLFSRCRGKRTILINPDDIIKDIGVCDKRGAVRKFEITKKQLEVHMKNLVLDGYIDYSITDNKEGQSMYVVTLTTRGEAFQRERDEVVKRRWRSLGWKILLTLIACGITSIFWLLR